MDNNFNSFINLSAALTGFQASKLSNPFDTQKVAEVYFEVVSDPKNVDQATFSKLLATFNQIAQQYPTQPSQNEQITAQILNSSVLGPLAKNINRMWYLGVWYTDDKQQNGFVVSQLAYINGLVWEVMEAHPMGYSQENFGYWETAPTPTTSNANA